MAYKDPEVAVQMAGEKQREENKRKWRAYKIELKPDRWMVCSGENGIDGVAKMVDDNQEANANLIASAPDMYKALEHVLFNLKYGFFGDNPLVSEREREIELVLAKANSKGSKNEPM